MAKTIHQMCVGQKTNDIYSKLRCMNRNTDWVRDLDSTAHFKSFTFISLICVWHMEGIVLIITVVTILARGTRTIKQEPPKWKGRLYINNSNFSCCDIIVAFHVLVWNFEASTLTL